MVAGQARGHGPERARGTRLSSVAFGRVRPAEVLADPEFDHAVQYANRIHANQTRKGTDIPYITHLLGVASLVIENGAQSEEEVIGALLHDAAEDQGGRPRLEDIREQFGERRRAHRRCVHRQLRRSQTAVARTQGGVRRPRPRTRRTRRRRARPPRLARRQAPQHPRDHRRRARERRRPVRALQRQEGRDDLVLRGPGGRVPRLPEPDGGRTRTRGRRTPPSRRHLRSTADLSASDADEATGRGRIHRRRR